MNTAEGALNAFRVVDGRILMTQLWQATRACANSSELGVQCFTPQTEHTVIVGDSRATLRVDIEFYIEGLYYMPY